MSYTKSNLKKENHSLVFIKLYALQLIYTLFEELMEKLSMCSRSYWNTAYSCLQNQPEFPALQEAELWTRRKILNSKASKKSVFSAVISEEVLISSQVHSDCHTLKRTHLWLFVDLMLPILDLSVCMMLELKHVASFTMEIIFHALWARCTFRLKRKHCFWRLLFFGFFKLIVMVSLECFIMWGSFYWSVWLSWLESYDK